MDKEQVQAFLEQAENEGIATLYSKGYQWFKSQYLPLLNLADTLLPNNVELIADCWYLVGDIYDFNRAPNKAIEGYKKALEYDDEVDGAYREIAHMYEQTGHYQEALQYINLALERMPDDEELMDAKASIQDSINYTVEPYLTENNQLWKFSEQLANGEIEQVIEAINGIAAPEKNVLQCLAQAHGAKEELNLYMETWERIKVAKGALELNYADWFYMPLSIYNQSKIWDLIKSLSPQIKLMDCIDFDSLNEHYGEQLSMAEEAALICNFHRYRVGNDKTAIKELAAKFPLWEEVQG